MCSFCCFLLFLCHFVSFLCCFCVTFVSFFFHFSVTFLSFCVIFVSFLCHFMSLFLLFVLHFFSFSLLFPYINPPLGHYQAGNGRQCNCTYIHYSTPLRSTNDRRPSSPRRFPIGRPDQLRGHIRRTSLCRPRTPR